MQAVQQAISNQQAACTQICMSCQLWCTIACLAAFLCPRYSFTLDLQVCDQDSRNVGYSRVTK